jgi:hypothetical protein
VPSRMMDNMQETPQKENDKTDTQARHALYVDPRLVHDVITEDKPSLNFSAPVATNYSRRTRTRGEKIFDWSVYGGISFIANEVLSGKIQNQTIEKTGIFYPAYERTVNGLHRLFRQETHPQPWKNWIKRPTDIFVMTLGGTLLVPMVKFFETRKSDLVRFYDKTFHGQHVAEDPSIRAAHDAMDREPKQSWWSLWKARLVVIPAAILADALIGSKDALSTKLFDKNNSWSSMHRINVQLVRKLAGFFGSPEIKSAILENANTEKYKHEIQHNEGKFANIGKTYGFLMILSAALAAGFYIASRIFARRHEEHKFYEQMHAAQPAAAMAEATPQPALEAEPASPPRTETKKPSPRIHDAVALARVAQPTTLSAGAV